MKINTIPKKTVKLPTYPARKARILDTENHYPCDEPAAFYLGPERTDIQLEGVNCTIEEFYEWFLETKAGENFCTSDSSLIDIGGSNIDLSPGNVISVLFEDVLNKQIDENAHYAKSIIRDMSAAALASLHNDFH